MRLSLPQFYRELREQNIVLAFLGVFSQEIMVECKKILTDRQAIDRNCLLILTSVFVELTENILKYSTERELRDGRERGVGIVVVRETGEQFTVFSGNRAAHGEGSRIKDRCAELNGMGKEQLREAYRQQRRESLKEGASGAGLGLIEIARRSSGPVGCEIEVIDEDSCFVSLTINIAK